MATSESFVEGGHILGSILRWGESRLQGFTDRTRLHDSNQNRNIVSPVLGSLLVHGIEANCRGASGTIRIHQLLFRLFVLLFEWCVTTNLGHEAHLLRFWSVSG